MYPARGVPWKEDDRVWPLNLKFSSCSGQSADTKLAQYSYDGHPMIGNDQYVKNYIQPHSYSYHVGSLI